MKTTSTLLLLACFSVVFAQNELYINGDELHIKGAETVFVRGDLHIAGSTGVLAQDAAANVELTGDWHKDHPSIQQLMDGTVIFSGTAPQRIVSNGNGDLTGATTYFTDMLFNNTNGLVYLDGPNIEVKNLLNFINNTRLRTGAVAGSDGTAYTHYVHVSNSSPAAITGYLGPGSPRYIEGRLRADVAAPNTYTLPVGIDMTTSNNTQVSTITFNQGSGVLEAAFTYDPGGAITPITLCGTSIVCTPDHGYWTISPVSGLATVDYDIVLNPGNAASNCAGVTYVVLKDGTYTGANTCGPNQSPTFTAVPRYGFTSFSQFRIGAANTPFPIEILYFDGDARADGNHLVWATSTETNSSHFDLERSPDAQAYELLTKVDAAGNSLTQRNYGAIDPNPFIRGTYYRLKMLDLDGTYKYSNTIFLSNQNLSTEISFFPNPFENTISLQANQVEGELKLSIYDALGKEVFVKSWTPKQGEVKAEVDLSELAKGAYFYKVFTNSEYFNGKLLKDK